MRHIKTLSLDQHPENRVLYSRENAIGTLDSGFRLYLCFIVSYFLHLPARIPLLAVIRFDLILIGLIFGFILIRKDEKRAKSSSRTDQLLKILFAYTLLSLPFAQWPGTVLHTGIPNLIKAAIFFYFTIALIDSERKLKIYMTTFLACQFFRVLEPLYLHLADGYWGSQTYIGAGEMMERLAGSPYDVINPNGLAFVIVSVLPFFHYLSLSSSPKVKMLYLLALPVLLYTLVLTASRSGFLALVVILFAIFMKSRRKLTLAIIVGVAAVAIFSSLTDIQKERYFSITQKDARGAESAKGRIEGVLESFKVAMNKPITGHGLGTSLEANFNAIGVAQPAHNLYAEIMQELGLIGLLIFLFFIGSIISNFRTSRMRVYADPRQSVYLKNVTVAMGVWLIMNIFFSFASYGLSSYEWYLFAGLSVVVKRLSETKEGALSKI